MNASTIFIVLIALFFMRCKSSDNNANNIAGTYVNQSENEYAKNSDTLVVSPIDSKNLTFSVLSRTGYQKIRNGYLLPLQFKQSKWTVTWNPDKQVLFESDLGRQFYYNADKKSLTIQSFEYTKIK